MKNKVAISPETDPGVRSRIVEHAASLSPQQRKIADYCVAHMQEIPFLSVPELAERTGASEATVVRFCQRIGYTGYSDLKMALVDLIREEMNASSPASAGFESAAQDKDFLAAMARLEQQNIERTLDSIDRQTFSHVAASLFKADHIFTFGLGISAFLADYAAYLFTEYGMRSTCLATRYTSPREQLVALRPSDLVFAFSFPPYSRQTLEVLEEVGRKGVPTAVITDKPTAPAAALAKETLVVSSHGMSFNNATSAANVLLNALVLEIASRHQGETTDAISRINQILREQTYVVET
ncbi:MAG: MurR/RpiR family transcriptional regulator [Woeseiaceae bacterium]|nr:MurR/RpiR family transcriptional regulator [Woeseiaceae bacterium]